MSRAGAIIVFTAALLLGAVSGCTLDSTSLNVFASTSDREFVMDGSLETVSASLQKTLHDMSLAVTVTKDGETVRIASFTNSKDSKRYSLLLNRVKTDAGERTRIRIEWGEDGVDTQFWFQLLELAHNGQAASASTTSGGGQPLKR